MCIYIYIYIYIGIERAEKQQQPKRFEMPFTGTLQEATHMRAGMKGGSSGSSRQPSDGNGRCASRQPEART